MESLKGKVVIITGSSSGLGHTIAVQFAKHQSKVVLTGRNEERLQSVMKECIDRGAKSENVTFVKADVTVGDQLQWIIDTAVSQFGRLDILVNNAGVPMKGDIDSITEEQYDLVFNTNVKAVLRLTQLAIPHLKKSQGCVVNMSSVGSLRASTQYFAYNMTKAALDMFTNALALELAPHKVRVNSVNPGEIKTSIFETMGIPADKLQQYFKDRSKIYPLERLGEPQEVADAVLFLASDAASFITGTKLPVDGGLTLTASWFGQNIA